MPIVINEFEVVPEAPAAELRRGGADAGSEPTAPADALEPCAVATVLRTLDAQALRVWAH